MSKLTYGAKKNLPTQTFAVVQKVHGPRGVHTVRKYPMPDIAHARNALARVAAFGTPAEKAAVDRKVAADYPGLAKRSAEIHRAAKGHGGAANSPHNPT